MKQTTEFSQDAKSLLASDIAKTLGWKMRRNGYDLPCTLVRPSDGAEVYFRINEYGCERMVHFSASLPRAKNGRTPDVYENNQAIQSPSIKVSISRGADAIAKALTTRLLPEFDRQLVLVRAKINEIDQEAVNHVKTLVEVAAALSLPVSYRNEGKDPVFNLYTQINEMNTQIKVDSSNSVKIELPYMSKEQALAVIKALQSI